MHTIFNFHTLGFGTNVTIFFFCGFMGITNLPINIWCCGTHTSLEITFTYFTRQRSNINISSSLCEMFDWELNLTEMSLIITNKYPSTEIYIDIIQYTYWKNYLWMNEKTRLSISPVVEWDVVCCAMSVTMRNIILILCTRGLVLWQPIVVPSAVD